MEFSDGFQLIQFRKKQFNLSLSSPGIPSGPVPPLSSPACAGGSVLTPHPFLPETAPVPTPTQVLKTAPYIAIRCHFPSNYPTCQLDLQLSNLSTQPTHFASCQLNPPPFFHVDMFPITVKTAFSGRVIMCPKSAPPRKSLVFKPFSYIYFSTFDIKHTTSTWTVFPIRSIPPL